MSSLVAAPEQHSRVLRHQETVMGTIVCFDIALDEHLSPDQPYVHLARARALLRRTDAIFSLWKPNSPMSRLRRGEVELDDVPKEIGEVLRRCAQAHRLSDGWFDAESMPGGIDPTGLVKGWAVQHALEVLTDGGLVDVMVNGGGDLATSGSADGSGHWRVGIQHPASRAHLAAVVEVDGALATSGCYERGEHLFDPRARRFETHFASATVMGPDLALADALATALAVAGPEGFGFIEALDGYEAFTVDKDGLAHASTGFRRVETIT